MLLCIFYCHVNNTIHPYMWITSPSKWLKQLTETINVNIFSSAATLDRRDTLCAPHWSLLNIMLLLPWPLLTDNMLAFIQLVDAFGLGEQSTHRHARLWYFLCHKNCFACDYLVDFCTSWAVSTDGKLYSNKSAPPLETSTDSYDSFLSLWFWVIVSH